MERWDTLSTQRRKPTTDLTPGHVQVSSGIKYIRNKKENVRNSTLIPGKNVSRDLGGAPLFIHLKKKLSSLEFLSTHTHTTGRCDCFSRAQKKKQHGKKERPCCR